MKSKSARPTILAVVPELMMGLRIEEAAKVLGAAVETAGEDESVAERIRSLRPALVIADLALPGLDLRALAAASTAAGVALVGFYPHVDARLRRAAREAGLQHVYPRSQFLRELGEILRQFVDPERA